MDTENEECDHGDVDDIPKHIQEGTTFTGDDPVTVEDPDSVWSEDADDTTA